VQTQTVPMQTLANEIDELCKMLTRALQSMHRLMDGADANERNARDAWSNAIPAFHQSIGELADAQTVAECNARYADYLSAKARIDATRKAHRSAVALRKQLTMEYRQSAQVIRNIVRGYRVEDTRWLYASREQERVTRSAMRVRDTLRERYRME